MSHTAHARNVTDPLLLSSSQRMNQQHMKVTVTRNIPVCLNFKEHQRQRPLLNFSSVQVEVHVQPVKRQYWGRNAWKMHDSMRNMTYNMMAVLGRMNIKHAGSIIMHYLSFVQTPFIFVQTLFVQMHLSNHRLSKRHLSKRAYPDIPCFWILFDV